MNFGHPQKFIDTVMFKEINEEPDTIQNTVQTLSEDIRLSADLIRSSKIIYIVGSGTSYHAGIVLQIGLLKHSIPAVAVRAPEFRHYIPNTGTGVTVILISQSGESRDILDSLNMCKEKKYNTICITNNGQSRLANETDISIITQAGEEKALAATKSHIAQIIVMYTIYELIANPNGYSYSRMNCKELSALVSTLIKEYRHILNISKKISGRIIFLGNGFLHAEAMEGALKFEETSNFITEAYPIGEYLHGPIQILSDDDTVIVLKGNDEDGYQRVHEKLREYTGNIITIGKDETCSIKLPENKIEMLDSILYIVPIQLLSNFKAVSLGLNPDKPTHLNKVVS